ncbi:DUF3826 domain-containing protein [Sinomicrobium sp. M5D2P17]
MCKIKITPLRKTPIFVICLLFLNLVCAQEDQDEAYIKVTNERAAKIIKDLGINDAGKEIRVRDIIAQQYRDLSSIHDPRDEAIEAVKKSSKSDEAKEKAIEKLKKKSSKSIKKLHKKYLKKLSSELTEEQVSGVKDGMTYGVLPKTYRAFQDMLPDLTQTQKDTILAYLTEAREHAIDAGSSKEKHGWFGKYKGKINNYLSAQGYDLKKAGEEWQERIKAQANNK